MLKLNAMDLSSIVIVLARPSESGNIGAVCRVMKNMGLSCLRLVAPRIEDESALAARAVHAADLWQTSTTYNNLNAAISDCALVVGISRRRGHKRKSITLSPKELALYLSEWRGAGGEERGGKCALVFGTERTGLETSELELCNFASHIDANPVFPSLNLSHAVQVYAYEMRCALSENIAPKGLWQPVDRAETDKLVEKAGAYLEKLGFYRHPGREEQQAFLRDIISRAGLTKDETRYLENILAKAFRLGCLKSEKEASG